MDVLREIGFSNGELKVYFALLELGESTIGPISKKSGITSAKVYPIIDKLTKKGLSSYIIKSGTKYFRVANPKQIINFLDEKNKKINKEKEELKKIIPQIESRQKLSKEIQSAEIYETYDGMKTLYNESIEVLKENKEDFVGFSLGKEEYEYEESKYFFHEYDTKRRAFGIKVRLLSHESQKRFLKSITKGDKNISFRYLKYRTPTGVIIFGNVVATIIWGEIPTAFAIKSKKIAEAYKEFFEDMWKIAKR